jgi:hypothetical protein
VNADTIDECESLAMKWGCDAARNIPGGYDIIVVGGDNTSVSRAFWKGYSLATSINVHIPQSDDNWEQSTMIVVDIPTEDNSADIKTRPDLVDEADRDRRIRRTFQRMKLALEAWGRWQGDTYFDRLHPIFVDLET